MQFNSNLNLNFKLNLIIPHSFSHSLTITIIVMIVVIVIDGGGAMVIVARVSTFSSKLELRNLQLCLHEKLHPLQLQILRELHPLLLHLHHLLQLRALRVFISLAKFQNRLRQFPHRASPTLRPPSSFASFPCVRTHHPRPLPLETLRGETVARSWRRRATLVRI